jgi:hypothetical protein
VIDKIDIIGTKGDLNLVTRAHLERLAWRRLNAEPRYVPQGSIEPTAPFCGGWRTSTE